MDACEWLVAKEYERLRAARNVLFRNDKFYHRRMDFFPAHCLPVWEFCGSSNNNKFCTWFQWRSIVFAKISVFHCAWHLSLALKKTGKFQRVTNNRSYFSWWSWRYQLSAGGNRTAFTSIRMVFFFSKSPWKFELEARIQLDSCALHCTTTSTWSRFHGYHYLGFSCAKFIWRRRVCSFSAINGSECEWPWVSVNSKRTRTSDSAWRTQLVHVRHTTSYAFLY